jgi:hypothetical protein
MGKERTGDRTKLTKTLQFVHKLHHSSTFDLKVQNQRKAIGRDYRDEGIYPSRDSINK